MLESLRWSARARLLLLGIVACAALISLCGSAEAAIYWGNGLTIGRANLDGSYPQDGYGRESYIGTNVGPSVNGACAVAVDGSHIYWGDAERGAIGRANLDGSDANYTFVTGAQEPCGLALDGSYVYWANFGGSTIGRARLDGTDVRQAFIGVPLRPESIYTTSRPCGIAVDATHVYWAGYSDEVVGRADISGLGVEPEFIPKAMNACGVAVNSSYLYWGGRSGPIGRAALDGSNPEPSFISGLASPCGLALDATSVYWIEEVPRQIGRANLDGSGVTKGLVTDTRYSCAVAVDSLSFSPPPPKTAPLPPPPPVSLCRIEKVRHSKEPGTVLVAVRSGAVTQIEVLTKDLNQRLLSERAPSSADGSPRRWWLKVWAFREGRLRGRLEKRSRLTVDLRVRCTDRGALPTTAKRSLTLTVPREPAIRVKSRGA